MSNVPCTRSEGLLILMSSVTETSTSVLGKQGEMDPSGMRCKKKAARPRWERGHDGSEATMGARPRWERGHDGSEATMGARPLGLWALRLLWRISCRMWWC